jgi:nicotinamidase-related amidase
VFNDFRHEDGDRLLASFRARSKGFSQALSSAREVGTPVCFANDSSGKWDGDSAALVRRALSGPAGDLLELMKPRPGEAFLVKPRYSAFDLTPLQLVLEEYQTERIVLMGMATEMCVAQTAIDARERGYKVTLLTDACATVSELGESVALEYLSIVTGTKLAASFDDI